MLGIFVFKEMSKPKYPKYSVLMSIYAKEKPEWFVFAVDSMLNQTIRPDEIILVCDGPLTKELDEAISSLKAKCKILKDIRLEQNQGLGPALNRGIQECKNEYVARMDTDDFSEPERIEKQLDYMLNSPEIGLVGSNITEFEGNPTNTISKTILPETHEQIVKFSKSRNPIRHPSVIFKKSEVLKAGNYQSCYLCEDYDMWIRMIQNGTKMHNIQENLVRMRISKDFYTRRGGLKYFKSINNFKKKQVKTGYFTRAQYLKSIVPHVVVCFMPNFARDLIYRKLLRK